MFSVFLFLGLLSNYLQTGCCLEWRAYRGTCLKGRPANQTIQRVNSVAECQWLCSQETSFLCAAVEYHPINAFCRLRYETSINLQIETPCSDGYDLYEIREDVSWTTLDGACHNGNIDKYLTNITSVELCKETCLTETDFRCLSFDFDYALQYCRLSREDSKTRFVVFPCDWPLSVYYERDKWPVLKARTETKLNLTVVRDIENMIPRDCIGACLVESTYVCAAVNYDEATMTCSLLANSGYIGEEAASNTTAFILTDRFKWHYFPSACIVGQDIETVYNVTASGCIEACETAWDYHCVSVDYYSDGTCNLQRVWSRNTPLSVPCYERSDSVYYELNECLNP